MKAKALLLSNSNLFSVLSQKAFQEHFACEELNVRYANEEMTKDDFLFQQLDELYESVYFKNNQFFSPFDYAFNERLSRRVDQAISHHEPAIAFCELKNVSQADMAMIRFLSQKNIPLIVFVPVEKDNESLAFDLMDYGVKEIVTEYDLPLFRELAHRHAKTRF